MTNQQAHDAMEWLCQHSPVTYKQMRDHFHCTLQEAYKLDSIYIRSSGPGGKGLAWAIKQLTTKKWPSETGLPMVKLLLESVRNRCNNALAVQIDDPLALHCRHDAEEALKYLSRL